MSSSPEQLRRGDVVEVRPWAEIQATLDENGMREGLAFMPEMLKHCGQRFVVSKRIAGTYESAFGGSPHLRDVVLLRDVRCDGSGHEACRKACILCWKQTWLKRVDRGGAEQAAPLALDASAAVFPYQQADGRYRCQLEETAMVGSSVVQPKVRTEEPVRRLYRMSLQEYAGLQQAVGEKIVCVGGQWWRRVRSYFFRPLLPFQEFPARSRELPSTAWLGGVQHVVPCGQQANSTMSFLMFIDGGDYSVDSLRSKPRRQVRLAEEQFSVSLLTDRALFKEQAFPVYTEFYARTRYRYLAERSKKQNFDRWADAIYDYRTSLILGAYRGSQLCAVSIAHAVEDTLIYSTVFATAEALRDHVSSLLLHTVRLKAREDGSIARVYAGMPKTSEAHGIDEFLMRRGCQMMTKPAYMWLNPASKLLLRWFLSGQYARLRGDRVGSESMASQTTESSSAD
jgi:hypothetical protein